MTSKLARMVEEAVNDCISYGRGFSKDVQNMIDVEADWADNGQDIEITIFENCVIRFTYTEHIED